MLERVGVQPSAGPGIVGVAVAAMLFLGGQGDPAFADGGREARRWVGTWSTSPVEVGPAFQDQTLRQIARISIGGNQLRVRLSNLFGTGPLTIAAASIGVQSQAAELVPGSRRELRFGGEPAVTIPPGARVLSDPVALRVPNETDLAVSVYVAGDSGPSTMHTLAHQTSFISGTGDFTDQLGMPVAETTTSWFWLTGIEVQTPREVRAVVTLGDSITEGFNSTTDANARYPDELARQLSARGRGQMAVLNAGISGNRVLTEIFGPNAQSRLDRDVLTQSGVTHVILLEGVNDLGIGTGLLGPIVTADEVIAGYRQIIARTRAQGLKILLGTILPFRGFEAFLPNYWTPENEAKRQTINQWIRTTHLHDGFIDFDRALRDPDDPERMLEVFDSGDHLHPGDAGYRRMGEEAARVLRGRDGDEDDD